MTYARLYILSGVMKKFILCLVVVVVLSGCTESRNLYPVSGSYAGTSGQV